MKKFVIERKIEGVGRMNDRELSAAAATSNKALAQLAPKVQWVQSYVAADRTFASTWPRKRARCTNTPASVGFRPPTCTRC